MTEKRRWNAYVCPACRLVFKFPDDSEERGACCPACHQVLHIPDHQASGTVPNPDVSLPTDEPNKIRKQRKRDRAKDAFSWENESEPKLVRKGRRKSKPPIFNIISIIGIIITGALLAWLFVKGTGSKSPQSDQMVEAPVVTPPKPQAQADRKELDTEPLEIPAEFIKKAEELAGKFLSAQSVEELRGLVRNPDITIPRIMKLHPDGKIDMGGLDTFNTTDQYTRLGEFISVSVRTQNYEERIMVFAETADGIRIDWESWVAWCEMSWEEFLNTKPSTGTLFRVKLNKTNYYNFNFSDESKWTSYILVSHDLAHQIYGYVEQDSLAAMDIASAIQPGDNYFTLSLRFPEKAKSDNQVIIDRVINNGWIEHTPPPP
jgi:hypothetical protein